MKKRSHFLPSFGLFWAMLCLAAMGVPAQAQTAGSIHGSVIDPAGAHIPNAVVTITKPEINFKRATQSDAAGDFSFPALPPGSYKLHVAAKNFNAFDRDIVVVAEQIVSADVRLAVAGGAESVQVVGQVGQLESFATKTIDRGVLGNVSNLDTPYSVTYIPSSVIENQHITTMQDLLKYVPSAQFENRFGVNMGRLMTRGYQGGTNQGVMIEGIGVYAIMQFALPAYDSLEVTNGLGGGVLYGPANPSGTFNFIFKRPTAYRTETFGADYDDMGVHTWHGDFAGMLGKYLGYRINLLEGNGTSWVSISKIRQNLESGNFDIHYMPHGVLELNYLRSQYYEAGLPGGVSYSYDVTTPSSSVILPKAPDPTKPGLGQAFGWVQSNQVDFVAKLKHQVTPNFRILAEVGSQSAHRQLHTMTNTLSDNAGDFTQTLGNIFGAMTQRTAILYLNGEVKTGRIQHKLVAGANAWDLLSYAAGTSTAPSGFTAPTGDNIYNPIVVTKYPTYYGFHNTYKSGDSGQENLIFGDTASYGRWLANFTGSESWIFSRTYSAAGVLSSPLYVPGSFNPMASLSFKPIPSQTAYFSYSTSIANGGSTGTCTPSDPTTNCVNPGQNLPPIESKQYEAGYKAEVKQMALSMALFHMDRPYAYQASSTTPFQVQGHQVNRGLELNASGMATRNLNVFGGLTWLDSRMRQAVLAICEGKQYVGAARVSANALLEYQLADFHPLREVAVNMNYHLYGKRATNEPNTNWVSSVQTVDLGAHYSHRFAGVVTTARMNVSNVGNTFYWASFMPGSQTGASSKAKSGDYTFGDTAALGAPRTYSFSLIFTLH